MPKKIEKWFVFEYIGLELTPVSRPFKSKELAEKEGLKYSENIARELDWVLFDIELAGQRFPPRMLQFIRPGSFCSLAGSIEDPQTFYPRRLFPPSRLLLHFS